ncbi:MAG: penicillin-binding protein [Candidatus Zambryskibacteria bacterium]|nr:penicillin-binding protein [Candidatus Zambryskibacteria bacterium]
MKKFRVRLKKLWRKAKHSNHFLAIAAVALVIGGIFILWIASLRIPSLESIPERRIDQSTKIYDRTGEVLLYDMSKDVRREPVAFENISDYAKAATVAIEDKDFYSHNGFVLSSFLRAVIANLTTVSFSQGGSTITQQVVKNSILTNDKTPTRKLKELILALKLEKVLTKEEILSLYLNEIPYGGTIYGIEEASRSFFGKSASDVTLAEAAYLAAIPQAPTYYSPYRSHRAELEERKNLVLSEMLENEFISQEQFDNAMQEVVEFKPRENSANIKAPHFVFFVMEFLRSKYGEDSLENGGYKVITTLDYDIQREVEALALKYGETNQERFNADNNAVVAIDPKTGEILSMSGSRNYFDEDIDGNFNASTGHRQPGSTFKPFVYATLFNKGYTTETLLWDVPTQFSTSCARDNFVVDDICYAPGNYDDKFRGPITIRNALAQSINVPAVKAVYLAGVKSSVKLAQDLGIESLTDTRNYGLSIVLGGGSVSLLDMTAAYSVFANDGMRNPYTPVRWIEDGQGNIIDKHNPFPIRVLPEQTARLINDVLSDNVARTPGFGANSTLYIPERPVAVKTGTSNDYHDAWIIGYAPNLVVGAWVGNNDNTPMARKVSGLIVSPLWRDIMDEVLPSFPYESFVEPNQEDFTQLKPVLRGETGGVAHSILHWVDKDNPRGAVPNNPGNDSQYLYWEYGVSRWVSLSGYGAPPPPQPIDFLNPEPQPQDPGFIPVPEPGPGVF